MTALIGAVLIASLLGSAHCAGMCGAFLLIAVSPAQGARPAGRMGLLLAYNTGRLITYAALGAAAGALGAVVDLGAELAGIQRAAAMLAGAAMVLFGGISLARHAGVSIRRAPTPAWLQSAGVAGHRAIASWPPLGRAMAVGLLTTLLPCGWLYAFVITSAGTASPWLGALTMLAFWLGTLPIMVALGAGLQSLTGPMRRRLPALTSLLLIIVGVMAASGRLIAPPAGDAGSAPRSVSEAVARVRSLDHRQLPCCSDAR